MNEKNEDVILAVQMMKLLVAQNLTSFISPQKYTQVANLKWQHFFQFLEYFLEQLHFKLKSYTVSDTSA